jgi:hypothetical protein
MKDKIPIMIQSCAAAFTTCFATYCFLTGNILGAAVNAGLTVFNVLMALFEIFDRD